MTGPREVPGSSPLNAEQQDEMFKRYGVRYLVVADGGSYREIRPKTYAASIKTGRSKR